MSDDRDPFRLDPLEVQPAQGFGAPVEFVDPPPEEELGDIEDDVPDLAADRAQRWTASVIILLAILMALFNSAAIRSWTTTLPPDWTTETLRQLSQVWTDRIAVAGLDEPRAALRNVWTRARDAGWDGQPRPATVEPQPPS